MEVPVRMLWDPGSEEAFQNGRAHKWPASCCSGVDGDKPWPGARQQVVLSPLGTGSKTRTIPHSPKPISLPVM